MSTRLLKTKLHIPLVRPDLVPRPRLIERTAEATLMRSETVTFSSWVQRLPDALMRDRPTLCVYHAWSLLLSGRPLGTVDSRLQDAARSGDVHKTAPARALVALYQGRFPRAGELSL